MESKGITEILLNAALLSAIGAGIAFVYKALTGYYRTNMDVSLSQIRQATGTPGEDNIVLLITLKRGDRSTLALHDISVRFSWAGGEQVKCVDEIFRSAWKRDNQLNRLVIDLGHINDEVPLLKMTPGETVMYSLHTTVPSDKVCHICTTVLGQLIIVNELTGKRKQIVKNRWIGQWKASIDSLPLAPARAHSNKVA
jgi:hypothetical protein